MSAVDLSFDKSCRLHLKSMVDNLFSRGKTFYDFPLRLTWIALSQEEADSLFRAGCPADVGALQMLVTVPKKKRRRAVDRVLMRRRIREAYRINRRPLEDLACSCPGIRTLQLAFIYLKTRMPTMPRLSARCALFSPRWRSPSTPRMKAEKIARKLAIAPIRFYQLAVSPHFPAACRFTPTCSQYAVEAVERFGPVRGGWLAMKTYMPPPSLGRQRF